MSIDFPNGKGTGYSSEVTFPSDAGFSFGVLLGTSLTTELTFETGLLYLSRNFSKVDGLIPGVKTSLNLNSLVVPISLKFPISSSASLALGPFLSYGVGQISVTRFLAGVPSSAVLEQFDDPSGVGRTGLGVAASFRATVPLSDSVKAVVFCAYLHELSERSLDSSISLKLRDLLLLGGLSWEL